MAWFQSLSPELASAKNAVLAANWGVAALGVVLAVRGARKGERWGWLLLNGLLGIAIGVMAALWPGITVLAFVFMIAAWALLSGGLMLRAAIGLQINPGP